MKAVAKADATAKAMEDRAVVTLAIDYHGRANPARLGPASECASVSPA